VSAPDDEFEAELRRLFEDDRLAVQPKADAGQMIVAGAQRRRRRRAALTSAGGVTMAAVLIAGGLTFGNLRAGNNAASLSSDTLYTQSAPASDKGSSSYLHASVVPPAATGTTTAPPTLALGGGVDAPPTRMTKPSMSSTTGGMAVAAGPLIGPDGYGRLKLGMTVEQAATQGVVLASPQGATACKTYTFSGTGVPSEGSALISPNAGVAEISPAATVTTPEGVGPGSMKSDIYSAYPVASEAQPGRVSAPASGTGTYVFGLDSSGQRVTALGLENPKQDCAG
jgi:hypothetical protein